MKLKTFKTLAKKKRQELKKLHRLIIHKHNIIADDKEWYRLARKETKAIEKLKDTAGLCSECFGKEKKRRN